VPPKRRKQPERYAKCPLNWLEDLQGILQNVLEVIAMGIFYGIKAFLKQRLTVEQRSTARKVLVNLLAPFVFGNLTVLAKLCGTDKTGSHWYTPHYMTHLRKFKNKNIRLLEIGVGGYENPNVGGHSLRMWKKYFPFGKIYSIDIYDKSALQERRIKIYQGSQVDNDFLERLDNEVGPFDVIIDDGSHLNEHIIETFKILFPKLKDGGIYAIEDIQTSYWEDMGGDSKDLNNQKTAMNFLKSLTDCLNHQEILDECYQETYFDKKIISINFYHNLVFIYKGDNNEKSNVVKEHKKLW
jgi:demethylmacrocin O-methyltransferase